VNGSRLAALILALFALLVASLVLAISFGPADI